MDKRYSPEGIESKWYAHWQKMNYFASKPDHREAYTIVIPPPNVTGILHMGHMLNNTIQDILIRKARLDGKNACWVPGTDHASIATEAKVVQLLRKKGIKKSDLSREEFMEHAWEWKDKYGGIILDQLQRLGASCDWERTRFTMEDKLSAAVVQVFIDLYKKGKLYRGLRMTNWDPAAQTVLSNEEVIHEQETANLYFVKYKLVGEEGSVTIATTRPETILGDSALAVHPKDKRYEHLIGKEVEVPLVGRAIPIIADTYVDREFGTGALKITPAHDVNDYEIGKRHNLETIDVLNPDGTMSESAGMFVGDDRFIARKKMVKALKKAEFIDKIESYTHSVGYSERTKSVVEPRLSLQWFVEMKTFASSAMSAVQNKEVTFHPAHFENMYNSWLKEENVRDWCISRQLWWGQRIPAFYLTHDGEELVFVATTMEEALAQAQEQTGNASLKAADLRQDEDVLDTWFSSWLWPISVFDGFENQEELKYYYPTNTLVTGWDIMFFWVARMIMAGYQWSGELLDQPALPPFNDVFFTGMVRDTKRRKMSKSLGNSPDALALIDRYGADGVRFGMLSCASAGNDIIFDAPIDEKTKLAKNESQLCEQGTKFCNKMWNALRLIKGWTVDYTLAQSESNALAYHWMRSLQSELLSEVNLCFMEFRLSDAQLKLYTGIWDDFCSWYLEMVKPGFEQSIDAETYAATVRFYEKFMIMLHPFMPFITEEIWHQLADRDENDDVMMRSWPHLNEVQEPILQEVDWLKKVVTASRELRSRHGMKQTELLPLRYTSTQEADGLLKNASYKGLLRKLSYLSDVEQVTTAPENGLSFQVGVTQLFLVAEIVVDQEEERRLLEEDLDYQQGFLLMVSKKLGNERFVNNAPDAVVAKEKQKEADAMARIENIRKRLAEMKA